MKRLETNSPLDKLLDGGLEHGAITNVYGPAGAGKTNVALLSTLSCLSKGGKVIYVDTEGSFSFERFRQIGGAEEKLKNLFFFEPGSWQEQHGRVQQLEEIAKNNDIGLIVVDSLVALYRLELSDENHQAVNRQLATQYSILSKISRKNDIPVLVTSQVYSKIDEEGVEVTSNYIAKFWSKALVEIQLTDRPNHRIVIIKKHRSIAEGRKIEIEITANGIKEAKRML